jgi:hypothetical protein
VIGVALCALVFHGLYFNDGVKNLIDLGVAAVDSERILEGQVFGKDFIAPYGPGRYYLIAGAFGVFGRSMTVLLSVFLVLRVLVDVGTFLLARRLLPWIPALGAVLCVALAHGPTHKGFLTAGIVALLLAAAAAHDRPTPKRFLLLGIVVSLAGAFRYDLGFVGLVAAAIVLASHRTQWKSLLAGAVLAALPAALLILSSDPARLIECELSRAALLKGARARTELTSSSGTLSLLLLAAPVLVAVMKRRDVIWIVTAVTGILLFSQFAIEPKINRLLQVGPPLFLCLFHLARRTRFALAFLFVGITGWYVIADSGQGSIDSVAVLARDRVRVDGFTCGPRLAEGITASTDWIERNGGTFYASPAVPLLHFLTGIENPAPVTDFTYLFGNDEMQRITAERLGDVDYYLFRPALIQGFDPMKEAPILSTYIRAEFRVRIPLASGFVIQSRP